MNRALIRYILGQILKVESAFMPLPCITAIIYLEHEGIYYLVTALLCLILGFIMTCSKPKNMMFYFKEGCITTALC